MKRNLLKLSLPAGILSSALLLACASASATTYTELLGENDPYTGGSLGPGNGPPESMGVIGDNYAGGHATLAYAISNNGANQMVPGDVLLYNPYTGALSDVLRFEDFGVGYVFIYSGTTGVSSIELANTGFPSSYQANTLSLTEEFNGLNLGYFNYTPTAGQPGYSTDNFTGYTGFTYDFTSDEITTIPDNGMTAGLLGTGLLALSVFRRKLPSQARV
jgi:hypothetical protein